MTRDEAKRELFTREPDFLEKAKKKVNGHPTYICPECNNGSGSSGDGIALDPTSKNKPRYKCFKCGLSEDIIGLWKIHTGQQDNVEAFNSLYKHYGLEVGSGYDRSTAREDFSPEYQKQPKNEQYTHKDIHTNTQAQKEAEPDYTDFILKANKDIEKTDYHRGISLETLNRFKVGYVEEWRHPKAPYAPASPRLIIPTSKHSYLARDTRSELTDEQKKRSKIKAGNTHIFNLKTLENPQKPIFVVEGEIDAMSIIEVGGEAIGLGSTSMVNSLLEMFKKKKPAQPLIIALDNDEAGERASEELEKELEALGIPCYRYNPCGEYKDANEALNADREAFRAAVVVADSIESLVRAEYMKTSVANHLQEFINGIAASVNTPYIPTGFNNLDAVLDGGLYEGLYIVGAISSLGKTTLITQIADQIAGAGNDVLIFSLEMARTEIMAKSISRLTIKNILENNGNISNAKTTRGITTGSRYIKYSNEEREVINQAIRAYGEYADHIFISEGIGDIGADQIRATVKKHIEITGNKPVVIIDYLQILAPADIRATDKQNTDKAVMELKRISRDYKIPVIGISSFNRENYKAAVSMEAFKESGAIEYSSDVLIGLQFKGVGARDADDKLIRFDVNKAKAKNPREVELVILKNRNGATGKKLEYQYYPLFNYFCEV